MCLALKKNKFDKLEVNDKYVGSGQTENAEDKKETSPADKYKFRKTKRQVQVKQKPLPVPKISIKAHILMIVCFALVFVIRFVVKGEFMPDLKTAHAFCAVYTAVYVCVCVIPCIVYCFAAKKTPSKINFKMFSPKTIPLIFVGTLLLLCLVSLEKYYFAYTFSYREPVQSVAELGVLGLVLVSCLVPALCEEVLFRGVLQSEYSRFSGGAGGIIITSLLFSLWHADLPFFVVYFSAGIVLGIITHITGSVVPAMLAHFFNNLVSVFFADRLSFIAAERIGGTFLLVLLAVACFLLLIILLQMLEKHCHSKAVKLALEYDENDDYEKQRLRKLDDETIRFFCADGHSVKRFGRLVFSPYVLFAIIAFLVSVKIF